MKIIKKLIILGLVSLPLFAYAHGDEKHGDSNGIGKPGKETKVSRTIEINTYDTMKFNPDKIEVKKGETIKFVVINKDKLTHEFMLGELKELKEHAEMMRQMPNMKHAEKNAVTVEPGETKSLLWEFTNEGKVDFACLLPGHSEAGMVGTINVTKN